MVTLQNNELLIKGHLTQGTVQSLLEKIRVMIPTRGKVTVNFADVQKCDSSSLAFLTALLREGKKKQTHLSFVHLPKLMYELSRVSGLYPLLSLQE